MAEVDIFAEDDAELKVGSTDGDIESEVDDIERRRDLKVIRSPVVRTGRQGSQGGCRNFY